MAGPMSRFNRRKMRVRRALRKRASGRPRLSVFRSSKHIYAQVIDDVRGHTLIAASSLDPSLRAEHEKGGTVEAAAAVGKLLASAQKRPVLRMSFSIAAVTCSMAVSRRWPMPRVKAA